MERVNKEKVENSIENWSFTYVNYWLFFIGIVFIIAGDVIKTIYIPDLYNLIKVVALIGVREILSYFTNAEIEQLKKLKEDTILQNPSNEMS